MKKIIFFILLFFTISITNIFANETQFSIRFFDKKVYYPDSQILIKAEITNNSTQTFSFKLADNRVFNLDFIVKTLQNRQIQHSQDYIIAMNPDQPVFFREISLAPGEEYSITENLTKYVENLEPGVYVINGIFYPELKNGINPEFKISNYLNLSVRPSAGLPKYQAQIDDETGIILKKEPLPPDDVVRYFINARQKSQWEKYFLYLDLESIMLKNPEKDRIYRKVSDEERRKMLSDYKEMMKQEKADETILMIPSDFSIIKTDYTPVKGKVTAILKFPYVGYKEVKEYTYYLNRVDNVWYIYNYEVRNLGTE